MMRRFLWIVFIAVLALLVVLPLGGAFADEGSLLPEGVSEEELAAYWKFDETEGTIAYDSSPNKRNLRLHTGSTPDWKEGLVGGAFRFDSYSAFRMDNENPLIKNTEAGVPYNIGSDYHADGTPKSGTDSNLSVSFLLKIEEFSKNTDQGFNQIFTVAELGALGPGALQCAIFDTSRSTLTTPIEYDLDREHIWLFSGVNGSTGGLSGNDNIVSEDYIDNETDKWMHIALVVTDVDDVDVMPSIKMFFNGELVNEVELMNTIGLNKVLGTQVDPLCIGGIIEFGTIKRGLGGYLDEFMIFTRALSDDEVEALATAYDLKVEENNDGNGGNGDGNGGDNEEDGNGGCGCGGAAIGGAVLSAMALGIACATLMKRR
jgi:hypothetical protein